MTQFLEALSTLCAAFLGKVLAALLTYIIGKWVIGKIMKLAEKTSMIKKADPTLANFIRSFVKGLLYVLLVVSIVGILGVPLASVVTVIASAGVAIGMSMQGSLSNLAGGIMLMIFKPFKVGDYLEVQGIAGTVKEIQIFNTIFTTLDNKQIIVPNGNLSTSIVTNYSKEETRRVDFEFSIAYGDDYDKAKSV